MKCSARWRCQRHDGDARHDVKWSNIVHVAKSIYEIVSRRDDVGYVQVFKFSMGAEACAMLSA